MKGLKFITDKFASKYITLLLVGITKLNTCIVKSLEEYFLTKSNVKSLYRFIVCEKIKDIIDQDDFNVDFVLVIIDPYVENPVQKAEEDIRLLDERFVIMSRLVFVRFLMNEQYHSKINNAIATLTAEWDTLHFIYNVNYTDEFCEKLFEFTWKIFKHNKIFSRQIEKEIGSDLDGSVLQSNVNFIASSQNTNLATSSIFSNLK